MSISEATCDNIDEHHHNMQRPYVDTTMITKYFTNENSCQVGNKRGRPNMNQIGESSLDLKSVESSSPPVDEIYKKSNISDDTSSSSSSSSSSFLSLASKSQSPTKTIIRNTSRSVISISNSNNETTVTHTKLTAKTPILSGAWGWFVPTDL